MATANASSYIESLNELVDIAKEIKLDDMTTEEAKSWRGYYSFNNHIQALPDIEKRMFDMFNNIQKLLRTKMSFKKYEGREHLQLFYMFELFEFLKKLDTYQIRSYRIKFCMNRNNLTKRDNLCYILVDFLRINEWSDKHLFDPVFNTMFKNTMLSFKMCYLMTVNNTSDSADYYEKMLEESIKLKKYCEEVNAINRTLLSEVYQLKDENDKKDKTINTLNEELSNGEANTIVDSEDLDSKFTCVVCIRRPVSMIGRICNHMSCCYICSQQLNDKCPICRTIGGFNKVYFN